MKKTTRNHINALLLFSSVLCAAGVPLQAHAQNTGSTLSDVSALAVASVTVVGSTVAGALVAVPIALSTTGGMLIVKTVESTVRGTSYVLERASDGARASIEIAGKGIAGISVGVGTAVVVSVVTSGVILSVASQAICFIPNELGRALMHNERVTF